MNMTPFSIRKLLALLLFGSALLLPVHSDNEAPCMGCRLFNPGTQSTDKDESPLPFCRYPCQCPSEPLECQMGVNTIKDGCNCCYMCARQLGDICSVRDLCDSDKGLYCSTNDSKSTGTCLGKGKRPCKVMGATYQDGERFYVGCSKVCTCQNGFYGCTNRCPQEKIKPSELTCPHPKLVPVQGKCCKEWSCGKTDNIGHPLTGDRGLESQSLVMKNPLWYRTSTSKPTIPPIQGPKSCQSKSSDWSACSVTCGVGMSTRRFVDKKTCEGQTQIQICYFRPCGVNITTMGRKKCTPTTRTKSKQHIYYMDCVSVRQYQPKFCTTCIKNKCCYPKSFRTKPMEFQCSGGVKETMSYMWIKKCRCSSQCFKKKPKVWTKRRRGKQNRKAMKERRRKQRRRWRKRMRKRQKKTEERLKVNGRSCDMI